MFICLFPLLDFYMRHNSLAERVSVSPSVYFCIFVCMCVWERCIYRERKRESERERQTDRQTETERKRDTERYGVCACACVCVLYCWTMCVYSLDALIQQNGKKIPNPHLMHIYMIQKTTNNVPREWLPIHNNVIIFKFITTCQYIP